MKALLFLVLCLPALAAEKFVRLKVGSLPFQKTDGIRIAEGEQLRVNSILKSNGFAADSGVFSVYDDIPDRAFPLKAGDSVTGPCIVVASITPRNADVLVVENVWTYNLGPVTAPAQSVELQRSLDMDTWSTLRVFEDTSTNAFYRWKIEPR